METNTTTDINKFIWFDYLILSLELVPFLIVLSTSTRVFLAENSFESSRYISASNDFQFRSTNTEFQNLASAKIVLIQKSRASKVKQYR